jgi:ethanolamine utilization protein EutN
MRIGEVIGTVTLSRVHPTLAGKTFKLVVPVLWDRLLGKAAEPAEEIVVLDELGAGVGLQIAMSEGREAAMPFHPDIKPVDAYNAALLDRLSIDRSLLPEGAQPTV